MDNYIVYVVILIVMLLVGGFVASFLHTKRADLNKCIGCQHAEICDKGNPGNKCHLGDE